MANPNPRTDQLKPWGPDNPPPKSPGGPRKRPTSDAYDQWLRAEVPGSQRAELLSKYGINLPKGITNADLVAIAIGRKAASGSVDAAREMREATEGKAVQRIELQTAAERGFEIQISYEAPLPVRPEIAEAVENKVLDAIATEIVADAAMETENE